MPEETEGRQSLSHQVSGFESRPLSVPSRRLARFQWAFLVLFAVVLLSLGRHAGAIQKEQELLRAKTIEAERFELQRPDGKQAAVLSTGPGGESQLSFLDQEGKPRLIVGLDSKGAPVISFFGEKNDRRMALSLDPASHSPQFRMFDEHGDSQLSVDVDDRLGPGISVGKVNGSRISLSSAKGGPSIVLHDAEKKPRIKLSINENEPVVELLDQNGTVRSVWRVRKDGTPEFALADRGSKVRLQLSSDVNGKSSVRFLDANGRVTNEIGQ